MSPTAYPSRQWPPAGILISPTIVTAQASRLRGHLVNTEPTSAMGPIGLLYRAMSRLPPTLSSRLQWRHAYNGTSPTTNPPRQCRLAGFLFLRHLPLQWYLPYDATSPTLSPPRQWAPSKSSLSPIPSTMASHIQRHPTYSKPISAMSPRRNCITPHNCHYRSISSTMASRLHWAHLDNGAHRSIAPRNFPPSSYIAILLQWRHTYNGISPTTNLARQWRLAEFLLFRHLSLQ